jgi:hypothetical protein
VTMKKSSWYPTYHRHHEKRNERYQNLTDRERTDRGWREGEDEEAGGGVYSDDRGERQEVRIQHGSHRPRFRFPPAVCAG